MACIVSDLNLLHDPRVDSQLSIIGHANGAKKKMEQKGASNFFFFEKRERLPIKQGLILCAHEYKCYVLGRDFTLKCAIYWAEILQKCAMY